MTPDSLRFRFCSYGPFSRCQAMTNSEAIGPEWPGRLFWMVCGRRGLERPWGGVQVAQMSPADKRDKTTRNREGAVPHEPERPGAP